MGNTQTNEGKPGKAGKSSGKVKGLMKIKGKKIKQGEPQFIGIVPQESETETRKEKTSVVIKNDSEKINSTLPEKEKQDSLHVEPPKATDSWYSADEINEESISKIATPSSVISSDSNFVDATQSPQEFPKNLRLDFDTSDVDTPDNFFHNLTLNSFKLNEYRMKHEEEKNKKLNKLGVSKISQISLESDPCQCFETSEVQVIRNIDVTEPVKVTHVAKRLSDASLNNIGKNMFNCY
ncbi:hypothetical protein HHI36_008881 [Cryptolaemus montrouzieri]|uniref:Uncharacterized protein n=1 Tax=Cryptolaemus montrouzieri TaxID=559131 RepID=A0ABD2MTP5_9CUCU